MVFRLMTSRQKITHIQYVLLTVVNQVLAFSVIFSDLKTALVEPFFKRDTPIKSECYRPIFLFFCIGKNFKKASWFCHWEGHPACA